MEKYKFIKPYSVSVQVGGAVGLNKKLFKVDDIIEGEVIDGGILSVRTRIAEHSVLNEGASSNASYQEFLDVPLEYLEKVKDNIILNTTKTLNTKKIFTTKNIVIGLAVITFITVVYKLKLHKQA